MGLLDGPRGLVGRSVGVGVGLARTSVRAGVRAASWSEQTVMLALAARLDDVRGPRELTSSQPPDLNHKVTTLLDRAVRQSTAAGRTELFHKIVDQLVPDEARIVGALSGGRTAPLMHVYARTRTGGQGEALIVNACGIGREANLALPKLTPNYVGHLLALGLVETGPEDVALAESYQILGADTGVLRAIKSGSRGPVPPIVERGSLRLSELGEELWTTAMGES